MGQEAVCAVKWGGQVSEGNVQLESDALLFRGEFRLRIPFSEMKSVAAKNGTLTLLHAGKAVEIGLGEKAGKWAHAILHPKAVWTSSESNPIWR